MDFNKLQHLLDGIASIDRAEDAETVVSIFSNIASSYGFSSYCILRMDNPARVPPERALRVANWPADYLDHRIKEPSYRLHDPVLSMAMRCRRPFFWHEAQETADKIGLKVMNESREFGLEKGLAYPIHDTSGIPGIVSLSYSDAEIGSGEVQEFYLAAIHVYGRLEALLGSDPIDIEVKLTAREREVLHWIASGKTSWDTSKILSLSPKTIEHYICGIRKKIGRVEHGARHSPCCRAPADLSVVNTGISPSIRIQRFQVPSPPFWRRSMQTWITPETQWAQSDLMERMFRMRYKVVQDWRWNVPGIKAPYDIDSFDREDTTYIVNTDDATGAILAVLRINETTKPHLMSEIFADMCAFEGVPSGDDIIETSRVMVDFKAASKWKCLKARTENALALAESARERGLRQMSFLTNQKVYSQAVRRWTTRPLGLPKYFPEDDRTYIAALSTFSDEGIAALRAELAEYSALSEAEEREVA